MGGPTPIRQYKPRNTDAKCTFRCRCILKPNIDRPPYELPRGARGYLPTQITTGGNNACIRDSGSCRHPRFDWRRLLHHQSHQLTDNGPELVSGPFSNATMLSRFAPFFAGTIPPTAIAFGFAATALFYKSDPTSKRDLAAEAQARRPFVLHTGERPVESSTTVGSSAIAFRNSHHSDEPLSVGLVPAVVRRGQAVPATARPSNLQPSPDVVKRLAVPADIIKPERSPRSPLRQFATVEVDGRPRIVPRWVDPASRDRYPPRELVYRPRR
jgi:hypothetical protein